MSNLAGSTLEVEAKKITDKAALAGSSSSTRYVSEWRFDSNSTSHNVVFQHNLGVVPTELSVQFSLDLETVYPLLWSWEPGSSGNPVSIWTDARTITLAVFRGQPLHGWWNGNTSNWTTTGTGYWRVIATV